MTIPAAVKELARMKSTVWVRSLMVIALALAGVLILANLPFVPSRLHARLSSLPLAMAGIVYAILQFRVRPPLGTLLKRLLLAGTFVTWAVDQLLPAGQLATFIGDAVIAAYVLDLYWLIQEQVAAAGSISDSDDGSM